MKRTILLLFIMLLFRNIIAQNGGYALNFDGNDYANKVNGVLTGITNITIEAWVNVANDASGTMYLVNQRSGGDIGINGQYVLQINDDLSVDFWDHGTNYGFSDNTSSTGFNITKGEWTHIAVVVNGLNAYYYKNGKLVRTEVSSAGSQVSYADIDFTLGKDGRDPGKYFKGKMDEVRVWTIARTETEINTNMYKQLIGSEANLVAYYLMSDGSGTSLLDDGATTNNLTISGATWVASNAFAGPRQALNFDGTNDYVNCNNPLNITDNTMSVESWIYPTNFKSDSWLNTILGNDYWGGAGSRSEGYVFRYGGANGNLDFVMSSQSDANWHVASASGVLTLNKWQHVAAIYNGTSVKLYVNGIEVASAAYSHNIYASTQNASISNSAGDPLNRLMVGKIDELRVWGDARTASEIRENMMTTLTGNEPDLLAYYRFDHYDGTTLYDMSANGHNGTLTNMDAADWVASTAFNTWIGSESSVWATAGNWSNGSAPAATDNVGLHKWALGNEATISGTPTVNHLLFSSTASPTLSSNFNLNGNLIMNKNLDLSTYSVFLNNLTSISNLVEGDYRLSATTGNIYTTKALSNISSQNVAGLGAIISSAANMGNTTITREHSQVATGLAKSILRTYRIEPTTNSGLNATLVFSYNDNELNELTEANLKLYKSNDLGTTWTVQSSAVLNTTSNTVSLSGIDGFSYWTLADENDALPVELTPFPAASTSSATVVLNWQTATEVNNYGFEIERQTVEMLRATTDEWQKIGFVEGHGNSNSPKDYTFTDTSTPLNASTVSYRLKQIDIDGKYEYSDVVEVNIENELPSKFQLSQNYPNPFNPSTEIKFSIPQNSHVKLELFNALGEKVATLINEEMSAGSHNYQLSISNYQLSSGVYFYKLQSGNFAETKKMILIK